ncbi:MULTISPECIES: hypothetical protein [unclassified Streptomyces]|uniref:hypothetical protein n=1 Tax=unclassified Streptomyces TaxID=2593676 RepID=UPI0022574C7E|nr:MULTISPECIES: hypothetical protein [unclassified Streptomyces]MCX4405926.1 hypothetical protein [Streptomyces sp. NBC_01764]MCX5189550.1 hypothetical protein [Streptomyces sp. NBC_00268]
MRLRQAHAILETATALEAAGLGIELFPVDHDREDPVVEPDDYLTGHTEITDPDHPDNNARAYHINLAPCADGRRVAATVTSGYGDDAPCLKHEEINVAVVYDEAATPKFKGLAGAALAERIADVIREHEKPYRAAYEERTRSSHA